MSEIDVTKCRSAYNVSMDVSDIHCRLHGKDCRDVRNCDYKQLHRYKQVVKETKEILQNEHPFVDCSCGEDILKIIQKCEEVNNE